MKRENQRLLYIYYDIATSYNQIKSNNDYSFFMAHFIGNLEKLNSVLEDDVEYPYDKLLEVYRMLLNMQTWKHIKAADKFNLTALKKELNIHIGRINTTYDL